MDSALRYYLAGFVADVLINETQDPVLKITCYTEDER